MRRSSAFAMAAGATVFILSGCSSAGHAAPTPTSSAVSLPDPKPSDLQIGDKVLIQKDGTGPTTLDLTGMVGTAKDVTVTWACLGTGDVRISDSSSSKVLVGAPCATATAGAAIDSGKVPVADVSSLRWNLSADSATHWRVVVYTDK
jgi:hypothetical protein